MFSDDIPPLKFTDVAQFDREAVSAVTDVLILTFPAHDSDLPDNSRILVSVRRRAHDGEAVAAATADGKSITGFYRVHGENAMIESLNHKIRLQWRITDENKIFHWIFPVLSVDMFCCTANKKALCRRRQRAEHECLLDRGFQIGNQID